MENRPEHTPAATTNNTPQKSGGSGLAIASMVLGILAIILSATGPFALALGIVAIVLGIVALRKKHGKGMAIAGIITGGVGLLIALIVTLIAGAVISEVQKSTEGQSSTNPAATTEEEKPAEEWDLNAAYDKVTVGMTKTEVEAATGKPSESCYSSEDPTFGKMEYCTYGNMFTDKGNISVTYDNDGKVSHKSKFES